MAYKDSFVDEYPYLVYSDDPEAVGGAGGGSDIGFSPDEIPATLVNASVIDVGSCLILVDAEGKRAIADLPIADGSEILVAPNAYVGLTEAFYIYAGALDAGERLAPAGSLTLGVNNYNTYQLTDPDETYSIRTRIS